MFLQIPSFGNEVFDQESQNESLGIKGELKRTTKDPKDGHSKNVILIRVRQDLTEYGLNK